MKFRKRKMETNFILENRWRHLNSLNIHDISFFFVSHLRFVHIYLSQTPLAHTTLRRRCNRRSFVPGRSATLASLLISRYHCSNSSLAKICHPSLSVCSSNGITSLLLAASAVENERIDKKKVWLLRKKTETTKTSVERKTLDDEE